jgi:hypothetical protein
VCLGGVNPTLTPRVAVPRRRRLVQCVVRAELGKGAGELRQLRRGEVAVRFDLAAGAVAKLLALSVGQIDDVARGDELVAHSLQFIAG